MPHITLALHEVNPNLLGCAVEDIAHQPIDFEVMVDHLSVIYQVDGQSGLQSRFQFGSGERLFES